MDDMILFLNHFFVNNLINNVCLLRLSIFLKYFINIIIALEFVDADYVLFASYWIGNKQ